MPAAKSPTLQSIPQSLKRPRDTEYHADLDDAPRKRTYRSPPHLQKVPATSALFSHITNWPGRIWKYIITGRPDGDSMILDNRQVSILEKAGYTRASVYTTHNGLGVQIVGTKNGRDVLVDERTWTKVVAIGIGSTVMSDVPAHFVPKPPPPKRGQFMAVATQPYTAPRPKRMTPFVRYVDAMSKPGTWGDEAALVAIATTQRARIDVFTDTPEGKRKHMATFRPEDIVKPRHHISLLFDPIREHYDLLVGKKICPVIGDGNCMFRAVAKKMRTTHSAVRWLACRFLATNGGMRSEVFGGARLDEYIKANSR